MFQAIQSSPEGRLTLAQIYDWMIASVAYFFKTFIFSKHLLSQNIYCHLFTFSKHLYSNVNYAYWKYSLKTRWPTLGREQTQPALRDGRSDEMLQTFLPLTSPILELTYFKTDLTRLRTDIAHLKTDPTRLRTRSGTTCPCTRGS